MRIVMALGSPNRHGSSALLAERFKEGAEASGHSVVTLDVAHAKLRPCLGCVKCGYEGPCAQHDAMEGFKEELLGSDMLVFVTPLYYYGFSAQLKTFIDRFCAFNMSLTARHMKCALIAAAWNSDDWTFDALTAHYKTLVRYLSMRDMGMVLGYGCGTPGMTKRSKYMQQAYELGRSLR